MAQNHICELCNRNVSSITKPHLIPLEKGGEKFKTLSLCSTCHRQIHALFTNRELATHYRSLESLKKDIKIVKFLKFIQNIPGDSYLDIKKSRHVRKSC
ncbi:HNH endonuclease [Clostridium beijerinckii]|uniref:HNH endonuclease n=1 Tax=Clostridium beijerinckii TaxID=1520 RepID=UPI001F2A34A2|nr:HNH endonuclease [Clostridium beijerinckii]